MLRTVKSVHLPNFFFQFIFSFLYLNLNTVVIDLAPFKEVKLIFPCGVFVGVSDSIQAIFLAGKTTEINVSAHAHITKPLTIASMIALQVVRASFGFHLKESMGT